MIIHAQASTGMTTGSWFVSFGNDLEEALEAAEEELRDAYVIPAVVKVSTWGWSDGLNACCSLVNLTDGG